MESINAKSERALDETRVFNERLALIDRDKLSEGDRVANLEAEIRSLKAQLASGSNSKFKLSKTVSTQRSGVQANQLLGISKGVFAARHDC